MKRCHQKAGTSVTGGFSAPFMRCMEGENPRLPAVASPLKANLLRTGLYGFYIEVSGANLEAAAEQHP